MPGRSLSTLERRLLDRWNDNSGPSLRSIEISGNRLRGLKDVVVDFHYPLTVIAGKNGVGKSTILACAACAYKNTTGFQTLLNDDTHFNFNNFLVLGWGDTPPQDVNVTWTYRDQKKNILILKAHKQKVRWDYPERPDRPVDFVGTIRAVHPLEFKVLHKKFGVKASVKELEADEKHRETVSRIIGVDYSKVRTGAAGKHRLHRLHVGSSEYSGFNAGSGEEISCVIARVVNRMPKGGLLIIEEIETGLHASAQRRLAAFLLKQCLDRNIQVICSTHSSEFLEAVPTEARLLVSKTTEKTEVVFPISVQEATSDLLERPVPELVVCVEDSTAYQLVWELLPSNVRTRVRIVPCGSWDDVLRQLSAFRKDPNLGNAIGLVDGERTGKNAEHFERFASHMGAVDAEEINSAIAEARENNLPIPDVLQTTAFESHSCDGVAWLAQRLFILPGQKPPEKWLWDLGRNSRPYQQALAATLNAPVAEIDSFFKGVPPGNHHDLPYQLSLKVGNDPKWVLGGLCKAVVGAESATLQGLLSFVENSLGED